MKSEYWLTRIVYLRFLGFMYLVAFLVAYHQNESLIGENGLTPANRFMARYKAHFKDDWNGFMQHPTIFSFIEASTQNINRLELICCAIAFFIVVFGCANIFMMFALWAGYFSIVNIGQTWYSFGWESHLLEVGFLSMFLVPLFSLRRFPQHTANPWICIWGNRWLLFRIMLGAGLIKIRGDQCWRDLTCMNYHYQTQPVPNPISIYFHNTPEYIHKIETMGNHIVELVMPFLLLIPQRDVQIVGGTIQILFQCILISSGNLAFLNWLTILPALMCYDDEFLSYFFSKATVNKAKMAAEKYNMICRGIKAKSEDSKSEDNIENTSFLSQFISQHFTYTFSWPSAVILTRRIVCFTLTMYIAYRSYPVIANMMSERQMMNASFDPFRIVNTYGAFGSITKIRHEVILQGTKDKTISPKTKWYDIEFTCKPGDINRIPCLISPYHFRIDWLMWFAAFQSYQQCPWIVHLSDKLLNGEPIVNQLLAKDGNPFYNSTIIDKNMTTKHAPKFVRAMLYEYQYPSLNAEQREREIDHGWEVGKWWKRKPVNEYMPAIEKNNPSVQQFLQAHNMK